VADGRFSFLPDPLIRDRPFLCDTDFFCGERQYAVLFFSPTSGQTGTSPFFLSPLPWRMACHRPISFLSFSPRRAVFAGLFLAPRTPWPKFGDPSRTLYRTALSSRRCCHPREPLEPGAGRLSADDGRPPFLSEVPRTRPLLSGHAPISLSPSFASWTESLGREASPSSSQSGISFFFGCCSYFSPESNPFPFFPLSLNHFFLYDLLCWFLWPVR